MQPKYKVGQLLVYKLKEDNLNDIDLGMVTGINRMKHRVPGCGEYTYNIEWFRDYSLQHKYIEEDMLDAWVEQYICFRKQNAL